MHYVSFVYQHNISTIHPFVTAGLTDMGLIRIACCIDSIILIYMETPLAQTFFGQMSIVSI